MNLPELYDKRPDRDELTLRDRFALGALSGLLCDPATSARGPAYTARAAYRFASAMMREREIPAPEEPGQPPGVNERMLTFER